jgi:hypothetical protein
MANYSDTQTLRHSDTQTLRHSDTQTLRHSDTQQVTDIGFLLDAYSQDKMGAVSLYQHIQKTIL